MMFFALTLLPVELDPNTFYFGRIAPATCLYRERLI